jgi:outer membrane receptor protein involved in Fe transport
MKWSHASARPGRSRVTVALGAIAAIWSPPLTAMTGEPGLPPTFEDSKASGPEPTSAKDPSAAPATLLSSPASSPTLPSATVTPPSANLVAGWTQSDDLDLSLEELLNIVVTTSSRSEEGLNDAPNTMYVITRDEICRRGYRTLREVLRTIPGMNVFHKDIQFVGQVRGIAPNDNEKIALLVNGHDISNVDEPDFMNGPIDVSIADRIEIIIGPGSVLYGTDALLAIVNIITKTPEENEVFATLGNYMRDFTAILGGSRGDAYLKATVTAMSQKGWDAWDAINHDGAPLAGRKVTGQLDPSYFLTLSGGVGGWTIQGSSLNDTFPDLKHAVSTPAGMDGKRYERVDSFEIRNDHRWTQSLSSRFLVSYDNKRSVRAFTQGPAEQQGESTYDLSQQTYKSEVSFHHQTKRNYFQAGVQFRADQNRNNYMFDWDPSNPARGCADGDCTGDQFNHIQQMVRNKDTYRIGAYFSDSLQLLANLKLVAAMRVDKNTIIQFADTYLSPRVSVVYRPVEAWTTKINYNTATRTPVALASPLNEVWGSGNPAAPSWGANNELVKRPEVLTAVEWQNIATLGKTRLSLTLYYQRLKDFISWGGPYTNVGDFTGEGGELWVTSSPLRSLGLWGNMSYTHTHFQMTAPNTSFGNVPVSSNGQMAAVPAITANVGADVSLLGHMDVSAALRYFTLQPTYDCNVDDACKTGSWGSSNNRIYADLTVRYRDVLLKGFDLAAQVYNLFNNTSTVAAQYFQGKYREQGIGVTAQARYRF